MPYPNIKLPSHLANDSHVSCEQSREWLLSSKHDNTNDCPDEWTHCCHAYHDVSRLGHLTAAQVGTAKGLSGYVEALKELNCKNPVGGMSKGASVESISITCNLICKQNRISETTARNVQLDNEVSPELSNNLKGRLTCRTRPHT